jgi:uncharacterized membrane protein YsdA (DUF1294 family)
VISIQELQFFFVLLLVLNITSFLVYINDKRKAVKNTWRTPERILLIWGLIAPFGAYLAMRMFRHKTQKTKFLLVPVFLVLQLAVIAAVVTLYIR